ncbi:MAG: M56 family metallopeptidase [Gammaproteobacteria bacterium]|nr:M56 family metallopeptidase [Gammaproteobacteria bacterium]
MTEFVHIDARWIVQLVLCSALLSAFAFVAFRSNPVTRRAYALIAGLVLTGLPFALALTSGWHWTAPFEVLTLVSLAGSVPIPVWLIAAWATGAVVLNLRALFRLMETRRQLAALPPVDDARITAEAAAVARRLAFGRPYQLHFGANSCSSSLAGDRIVIRADAKDWEPRAVRAVLAHEFVHLARRDDLWLFALGLVLNWYWFAPWVSLLRQQYAGAMEQSCDDRAAEMLPSCADYLDGVLCAARAEQEPSLVAGLAGSGVVLRFQRFLGNRERQLDVGGLYWGLVVGLGVALLFTSVEFEAHEAAPVASLTGYSGLRTLTLEPRLDVPQVSEQALGGDRAVRHAPAVIYPGRAINDGIEGHVVVEYTVSGDGRVVRPTVVASEPPGVFDDVALRAVARREYVPNHELAAIGSPSPPERIVRRYDFELPYRAPMPSLPSAPSQPPPSLPPPNEALPEEWVTADPAAKLRSALPRVSVEAVDADLAVPVFDEIHHLPIVKVAPIYPAPALANNVEGHVLLEFAVTTTGAVRNPVVLEAEPPGVFDQAALDAVAKFRYKPTVMDGEAVEVTGVRNRVIFEMSDE